MGAIFANAVILFALGTRTLLRLTGKQFRHVSDKTWRMWIEQPKYREGRIGELLDEVTLAPTLPQLGAVFDGLRQAELAPIHRGLKVMKVCIAAAPLLGLLGTVTGMLATFAALAAGQGGDKTMEAVSQGISEALITTMTGLVVALPGLFCHYGLSRLRDRYAAFLARLETGCTQDLYRRIRQRSGVAA
ncbi:MAG: MotA/TolQ/ExbB proton channel family protein [Planctomycetes bacterium]|nr:MotA/TolQ/ExbB proton channel family protein [Planctomycetota bacterium]